jgi:hypothetical protein
VRNKWIKSQCTEAVAREEMLIIAKMIQPVFNSLESNGCTVGKADQMNPCNSSFR